MFLEWSLLVLFKQPERHPCWLVAEVLHPGIIEGHLKMGIDVDGVHSYRLYHAAQLGDQTTSTMT